MHAHRLEPVIEIILDLIYTSEFSEDQLRGHIVCIDMLIDNNLTNNLLSSFKLEELKTILRELLERRIEPSILSKARVLRTITPLASIIKNTHNDPLVKYVSIDGLFKFFSTIVLADIRQSDQLTLELLIECISWKHFLALVPRLLCMTNTRVAAIAHIENIEEVITTFQRGATITADQLTSCFNPHAFPAEGIPFSWITGQVNFQELAHALNELGKGRSVDLRRIWDPRLLEHAINDLDRATDPHRPFAAQLEARSSLINQMMDTRTYDAVKYHLLPACEPVVLWLGLQGTWPTYFLALFLAYALIVAHERLEKHTLSTRLVLNGAAHTAASSIGLCMFAQLRERQSLVADIEQNIPSLPDGHEYKDAEVALRSLVNSLTDEQAKLLPRASNLCTLLSNPLAFIRDPRNELFISTLCEDPDQSKATSYIYNLTTILETIHRSTGLSYYADYENFVAGAFNAFNQLRCRTLISLARYNPHLLKREHKFIRALDATSYGQFQALLSRV